MCSADSAGRDVGAQCRLPLRCKLVAHSATSDRRGNGQREAVDVRSEADQLGSGATARRRLQQVSSLLTQLQPATVGSSGILVTVTKTEMVESSSVKLYF